MATLHLERRDRGPTSASIAVRHVPLVLAIVVIGAMTSGCEAIGAIFKAGVWVGVIESYSGDRAGGIRCDEGRKIVSAGAFSADAGHRPTASLALQADARVSNSSTVIVRSLSSGTVVPRSRSG